MNNILNCPVCLNQYSNEKKPHVLFPCGHTICNLCLYPILHTIGNRACPICRKFIYHDTCNWFVVGIIEQNVNFNQISNNNSVTNNVINYENNNPVVDENNNLVVDENNNPVVDNNTAVIDENNNTVVDENNTAENNYVLPDQNYENFDEDQIDNSEIDYYDNEENTQNNSVNNDEEETENNNVNNDEEESENNSEEESENNSEEEIENNNEEEIENYNEEEIENNSEEEIENNSEEEIENNSENNDTQEYNEEDDLLPIHKLLIEFKNEIEEINLLYPIEPKNIYELNYFQSKLLKSFLSKIENEFIDPLSVKYLALPPWFKKYLIMGIHRKNNYINNVPSFIRNQLPFCL